MKRVKGLQSLTLESPCKFPLKCLGSLSDTNVIRSFIETFVTATVEPRTHCDYEVEREPGPNLHYESRRELEKASDLGKETKGRNKRLPVGQLNVSLRRGEMNPYLND